MERPQAPRLWSLAALAVYVIVSTAYVANATTTGDCQNPLFFAQPNSGVPVSIGKFTRLSTPAVQSDLTQCGHLNGNYSCCDSSSFTHIEASAQRVDTNIKMYSGLLNRLEPSQIITLINSALTSSGGRAMTRSLANMATDLIAEFKSALPHFITCYGGFVTYVAGLLCFACDPFYDKFVVNLTSTDPNIANFGLLLSQNTCNGLYGDCAYLFDHLVTLYVKGLSFAIALVDGDFVHSSSPQEKEETLAALRMIKAQISAHGLCSMEGASGDCKKLVCQDLAHGLQTPLGGNMSLPTNLMGSAGWSHPVVQSLAEGVPRIVHKAHPASEASSMDFSRTFGAVIAHSWRSLVHDKAALSSAQRKLNVTNMYRNDSSGYATFKISCDHTHFSSHQCPVPANPSNGGGGDGSGGSKWKHSTLIYIGVAGGVFLVALVVAAVFMRRRRNRSAVHGVQAGGMPSSGVVSSGGRVGLLTPALMSDDDVPSQGVHTGSAPRLAIGAHSGYSQVPVSADD